MEQLNADNKSIKRVLIIDNVISVMMLDSLTICLESDHTRSKIDKISYSLPTK